ncbi:MAG: hypothetical protein GY804_08500 [Alphaproteobacteria bacterium]|nr:hypothetical protein [Alphaproteobacteria bacterium]
MDKSTDMVYITTLNRLSKKVVSIYGDNRNVVAYLQDHSSDKNESSLEINIITHAVYLYIGSVANKAFFIKHQSPMYVSVIVVHIDSCVEVLRSDEYGLFKTNMFNYQDLQVEFICRTSSNTRTTLKALIQPTTQFTVVVDEDENVLKICFTDEVGNPDRIFNESLSNEDKNRLLSNING